MFLPNTTGRGWTFTWKNGRELSSAVNAGNTISYTYDADGIRLSKTVNGVLHSYIYNGSKVLSEKYGNIILNFSYDEQGRPESLQYSTDNSASFATYYYVCNLQGDVVKILNSSGSSVCEYSYSAFGTVTAVTGSGASGIGTINPLRFKGYYFDSETGFYYLCSRYYDSETCRFINADDATLIGADGDALSYNLFTYCGNNPITGYDPNGTLDWGNLFKGSSWLVVGVTAIAVGVSVLTCGVAAPAMMAVAAITVAAGAATVVNGVSEVEEAVTGHNFMREDVFNGNSTAYNIYANVTAAVAEIGTMVCGGWLKSNAPRIEAYNNIDNYQYTKTISDAEHMSRPYANSILTQKEVIKYGKMTKDSFGYVFSALGSVNGEEKLWRLGVNIGKELIWHWGHGF